MDELKLKAKPEEQPKDGLEEKKKSYVSREPSRLGAMVLSVVSSGLVLAIALGFDISGDIEDQVMAVTLAAVNAGAILGVGEWIRNRVSPVKDDE